MMTLEQLRIFVAVAEREHLTEASKGLNLTPSAVSSAIRVLEERYQIQLFYRVGRQIVLSDAGKIFLDEARDVLARARMAETTLYELGDMRRGVLRIFASQTISSYWLPPYLAQFRARFPLIDLDLVMTNTSQAKAAVAEGLADMGFAEGLVDDAAVESETVADDYLVVVARPSHPLAIKKQVGFDDLAHASWIIREKGSGTRAVFEKALQDEGYKISDFPFMLTLPSNESILSAVSSGPHIAVISQRAARHHVAAGDLTILKVKKIPRHFLLLTHKKRRLNIATQTFIKMLHEPLAE